jgi:hypothetical protein
MQRLGRLTDAQIARGLRGSGATSEEVDCFTSAVCQRINALKELVARVDLRHDSRAAVSTVANPATTIRTGTP